MSKKEETKTADLIDQLAYDSLTPAKINAKLEKAGLDSHKKKIIQMYCTLGNNVSFKNRNPTEATKALVMKINTELNAIGLKFSHVAKANPQEVIATRKVMKAKGLRIARFYIPGMDDLLQDPALLSVMTREEGIKFGAEFSRATGKKLPAGVSYEEDAASWWAISQAV